MISSLDDQRSLVRYVSIEYHTSDVRTTVMDPIAAAYHDDRTWGRRDTPSITAGGESSIFPPESLY